MEVILIYLIVINSLCFLTFGYDKWQAKKNKRRISEFKLLFLTGVGGTIGGIVSMYLFKHKTNKFSFTLAFYAIAILQIVLFYLAIMKLKVV